ncbi:hypothetical protein JXM67_01965 [candidate division WOR-3 bacterium]|nr:hypothetical protein [candidate division WOR-3 bacterium]
MKRVLTIVFILLLAAGCRFVTEISKDEYDQVKATIEHELFKTQYPYGWEVTIKHLGEKNRFRTHNIDLKTKSVVYDLHLMPMFHNRIRRNMSIARRACRKSNVPFRSFNQAHSTYCILGLTYKDEWNELCKLLAELEPEVKRIVKEEVQPHEIRRYLKDLSSQTKVRINSRLNLDARKTERIAQLAIDLGLPLGGKPRIVIKVDKEGNALWDGKTFHWEAIRQMVQVEPLGRYIHLIPDPQLPSSKLLHLVDSLVAYGAWNIFVSNKFSEAIHFRINKERQKYRPETFEDWRTRDAVCIDITKDDRIIINNEPIDISEGTLVSIVDETFERAKRKGFTIIAHDSSSCGKLVKFGLLANRIGARPLIVLTSDTLVRNPQIKMQARWNW